MNKSQVFTPVTQEMLRPEQFVSVLNKQPATVASARFIPPRVGDNHFGHILVVYKVPRLRRAS